MRLKLSSSIRSIVNCVFKDNLAEIFGDNIGDISKLTMNLLEGFSSYQGDTSLDDFKY